MIPFSEACRIRSGDAWWHAIRHPFVEGVWRGTLGADQIRVYLDQDRLYLQHYVSVCERLAGRSPGAADRDLLLETARLSREAEAPMQDALSAALGLDLPAATPICLPATRAYIDHESACAGHRSLLVGIAAAAPCTWVYAEIGRWLVGRSGTDRSDHPYRAWIDLYADPSVQAAATAWIGMLDALGGPAPESERAEAAGAFAVSVRMEVDFWAQAWQAAPGGAETPAG